MAEYRRKAFWEAVERGNNAGVTAGLPRIESPIAQAYVRELEAENGRLHCETAKAKDAGFRAGWLAAMDSCGETDVDPDTDPAYQFARHHQEGKADV